MNSPFFPPGQPGVGDPAERAGPGKVEPEEGAWQKQTEPSEAAGWRGENNARNRNTNNWQKKMAGNLKFCVKIGGK